MNKHTPGPWHYAEGQVYTLHCDRPESGIADLRGADNTEADGHLIAAAPDLLAALKRALTCVEYVHEHEGAAETLNVVRAAIAKAEGRAQ